MDIKQSCEANLNFSDRSFHNTILVWKTSNKNWQTGHSKLGQPLTPFEFRDNQLESSEHYLK